MKKVLKYEKHIKQNGNKEDRKSNAPRKPKHTIVWNIKKL